MFLIRIRRGRAANAIHQTPCHAIRHQNRIGLSFLFRGMPLAPASPALIEPIIIHNQKARPPYHITAQRTFQSTLPTIDYFHSIQGTDQ